MQDILHGWHLELLSRLRLCVLALLPASLSLQTRAQFWFGWKRSVLSFPSCSSPGWNSVMVGWRSCFHIMQMEEWSPFSAAPFPGHGGMTCTSLHLIFPYFSTGQNGIMSLIQLLFWAIIELVPSS